MSAVTAFVDLQNTERIRGRLVPAPASGLASVFDSTLLAPATSIDTGANGIAQTFSALLILTLSRTDEAVAFSDAFLTFNGDAGANYDFQFTQGVNVVTQSSADIAANHLRVTSAGTLEAANVFTQGVFHMLGYAQTVVDKALTMAYGHADTVGAQCFQRSASGKWRSTAAVNQVALSAPAGLHLIAGSRMVIYGLG